MNWVFFAATAVGCGMVILIAYFIGKITVIAQVSDLKARVVTTEMVLANLADHVHKTSALPEPLWNQLDLLGEGQVR